MEDEILEDGSGDYGSDIDGSNDYDENYIPTDTETQQDEVAAETRKYELLLTKLANLLSDTEEKNFSVVIEDRDVNLTVRKIAPDFELILEEDLYVEGEERKRASIIIGDDDQIFFDGEDYLRELMNYDSQGNALPEYSVAAFVDTVLAQTHIPEQNISRIQETAATSIPPVFDSTTDPA